MVETIDYIDQEKSNHSLRLRIAKVKKSRTRQDIRKYEKTGQINCYITCIGGYVLNIRNWIYFMQIYIIDDNEIDLIIGKKILENRDNTLSISVCQSPVEALIHLENGTMQPDVILLDWYMPELHAEDWLTRFTEELDGPIPVFILTSSINPRDKQQAEKFGVVKGFFTKPLSQSDVEIMLNIGQT